MTGEEVSRMLVEIVTGKPHTLEGREAEALYKQLQQECDEIQAAGGTVEIPFEVPDL